MSITNHELLRRILVIVKKLFAPLQGGVVGDKQKGQG